MRIISIHALREEGDGSASAVGCHYCVISIHALREEGDVMVRFVTPSSSDFYPRPPRGGRLASPREYVPPREFLSTPSARRATGFYDILNPAELISIHALREEGDYDYTHAGTTTCDFYPRPPRGGRREACRLCIAGYLFLSTPSARRATWPRWLPCGSSRYFYPRPPRGGRRSACPFAHYWNIFLSTPSARRATAKTEKNISAFVSL